MLQTWIWLPFPEGYYLNKVIESKINLVPINSDCSYSYTTYVSANYDGKLNHKESKTWNPKQIERIILEP